ncbi:MAG: Do family serine endopeptidase [Pseudomonadota bacterium]
MKVLKNKSIATAMSVLALSGAVVAGGVMAPASPVLADAVRVQAPQAPSFADVVEAVSPAVVSVRVTSDIRPTSGSGFSFQFDGLPEGHPLERFFNREGRPRRGPQDRRGQRRFGTSQGSGFFVSDDGYVVTNHHVIENGSKYSVVLNDGTEIDAKLVGSDPKTDLAVLKVDRSEKFTYVKFSDVNSRVGEWVVAVGNPFGLGGTVTAGIISASGRDIGSGPYDDYIQIDAAVNKGNSGGPAFNLNGEVIGVNTAIFSPSGGNVGIAFAISAKSASEVVEQLIDRGSVTRGWLGVQIQPVTKDIAASLGIAEASGAIVSEAQGDSPASKAGIRSGDVITKVDGETIDDPRALARKIAGYEPSAEVKVTVLRDGKPREISVVLGELPGAEKVAGLAGPTPTPGAPVELDQLGLSVVPTDDGVAIASVAGGSDAEAKGIRSGDVIVSVNGLPTSSVNEVGEAIASAMEQDRNAVLFQIKSRERNRFVALPLERG